MLAESVKVQQLPEQSRRRCEGARHRRHRSICHLGHKRIRRLHVYEHVAPVGMQWCASVAALTPADGIARRRKAVHAVVHVVLLAMAMKAEEVSAAVVVAAISASNCVYTMCRYVAGQCRRLLGNTNRGGTAAGVADYCDMAIVAVCMPDGATQCSGATA